VNRHAYWFLGLTALSLLALVYTCYRARKVRTPLLLFGTAVGYGYWIEAIIYNFLGSYSYDPNLIKWNESYDSNSGALASNAFALPVAATLIAVLGLGWRGTIGFALLFGAIEWLFLHLGIYEHHWWRTPYTMSGLLFYFGTAIWLYPKLTHPIRGWLHKVVLYALNSAIAGSLHIAPIMFFGVRSYHPGWFADVGKDTTAFASAFYLTISLFYLAITLMRWRYAWIKYACAAAVMQAATIALQVTGLLRIHLWWDSLYYPALAVLMTWITGALHSVLLRK
jgi:hypothetical protein